MNSSELDTDWSRQPDQYEVEITESHRLSDASFNDTNNNTTLTFQGKRISGRAVVGELRWMYFHPAGAGLVLFCGRIIFRLVNMIFESEGKDSR